MQLRIQDNQRGNGQGLVISNPDASLRDDLRAIAEVDLSKEPPPGLLLFPQNFENFNDDRICWLSSDRDDSLTITTGNTLGFIGINSTELTISSRFAQQHDHFLHYMLQKVLSINVVNLDLAAASESIQDFLPYLFPAYLKKALAKGLFKKYRYNEYNDANVRGVIDVARHIRINIPFAGKVAYRTREYSHDNELTQLVRHTIEHLRTRPMWHAILYNDPDTRANVQAIEQYTPAYAQRDRRKVIAANRKPVNHPYFTEYRNLQKLCLQILRHEKISFSGEKDQIHGILFDGAWLWEEYIAKVFEEHRPTIQHKTTRDRLFKDDDDEYRHGIIPDFITYINKPFTASFIGDTKYKFVDTRSNTAAREDYFQVITYMYRYECRTGYILFPLKEKSETYISGNPRTVANTQANAKDGKSQVIELGLPIPQDKTNWNSFTAEIRKAEEKLIESI
jgi:5-methylcytosine-specific restriction endonuclease McrBC regulatory subunit McrC